MPPITTRAYRIRYHECDAYGHLNNSQYARLMQETAFDAAAEIGYGFDWCIAQQRAFLIRSTEIEFLQAIRYGDTLVVTAWVDKIRRVTARRRYELRSQLTGALVARGHSIWVFVDMATGRPMAIPTDIGAAFVGDNLPADPQVLDAPAQAALPSKPVRVQRVVEFNDIDQMRHMNNAAYLDHFAESGHAAGAAIGWPAEKLIAHNMVTVIRRLWVTYLQPAALGDAIEITAWLSDMRPASAMRHMLMTRPRDGVLLARCSYLVAFINLNTGSPMRWDKQLLQDAMENITITS